MTGRIIPEPRRFRPRRALLAWLGVLLVSPALAASPSVLFPDGLAMQVGDKGEVRFHLETRFHVRHSFPEERALNLPVPDDFFPPDGVIALRVPDKGTSFEVSNVALRTEASYGALVTGRVNIHFIDLYNRNPTSTADEIRVREAWLRFGRNLDALVPIVGTGAYLEVGRAPRFTRPDFRRLESYGLWGTALGRFEENQIEAGGSIGRHFYVKTSLANGNPLFFRDVNALAGDNGTPNRSRGNVHPDLQSGFPILYDAFPNDVNFDGNLQFGVGAGGRLLDANGQDGIDVLGWYFIRKLADSVPLDGTFYGGDLDLLDLTSDEVPELGEDVSIGPARSGDRKWEAGVNITGRYGGFRLFGQYVFQSIANLERQGVEIEVAYVHRLDSPLKLDDIPFFTWIQPAFRFSNIENDFATPPGFPAPTIAWDWQKYDVGVRLGIIRGIDFTLEYARGKTVKNVATDEILATLNIGI